MAAFDPTIHLAYEKPRVRHTMSDLGLEQDSISDVGITEPFRLLTPEGVRALRGDIFSKPVLDNYVWTSALAPCQLRGMSPAAKFVEDLWTHPETLRVCSDAAGMDLVPIMPYELGHTNIQTKSRSPEVVKDMLDHLGPEPLPPLVPSTESDSDSSDDETPELEPSEPVVKWHKDSYPWVCVVMLSDASTMRGGETAIECGDGSIKKIRGPELGYAVMLQGRYIKHVALGAFGAPERVTMVTSFRARDPDVRDESVLTTIRPVSKLNELYFQWSTYRLDLLVERFKKRSDEYKARKATLDPNAFDLDPQIVDQDQFKAFVREQIKYLQVTIDEMQ